MEATSESSKPGGAGNRETVATDENVDNEGVTAFSLQHGFTQCIDSAEVWTGAHDCRAMPRFMAVIGILPVSSDPG